MSCTVNFQAQPGNIAAGLFKEVNGEHTFALIEEWETMKALEDDIELEHTGVFLKFLEEMEMTGTINYQVKIYSHDLF